MAAMAEAAYYLKIFALPLLLLLALYCFTHPRRSARSVASGLFALSLAGYTICQLCHFLPPGHWLMWIIRIGCFSVPAAFFILTASLFEDKFRLKAVHLWLFLLVEAVNFSVALTRPYWLHGGLKPVLQAMPQIITAIVTVAALAGVLARRKADLVESRRRFRVVFLGVVSAAIFFVIVQELAFGGGKFTGLPDLVQSAVILSLIVYFGMRLLRGGESAFGHERQEKKDIPTQLQSEEERRLMAGLAHAMQVEKIYTQESLSIRELATHLKTREYILRRVINAGLGYRNFNNYLNDFRIAEARQILMSPEGPDTPIIRIAMDLGFGSLAPFNRAFKERTGVPPTEFRRAAH